MKGKTEFVVFCIESIAAYLNRNAADIYRDLSENSQIISTYIIPNFDVLHTQSKEYIVEDIIGVMREEGLKV